MLSKVFKHDNPLNNSLNAERNAVTVDIKTLPAANDRANQKDIGEHLFPNPLFYGDIIGSTHLWKNLFDDMAPKRLLALPRRNLAIVYLDRLLYPNAESLTYPVIKDNPSRFESKGGNVPAKAFGWCQAEPKYPDPRLTVIDVKLSVCSDIDKV